MENPLKYLVGFLQKFFLLNEKCCSNVLVQNFLVILANFCMMSLSTLQKECKLIYEVLFDTVFKPIIQVRIYQCFIMNNEQEQKIILKEKTNILTISCTAPFHISFFGFSCSPMGIINNL